MNESIEPKFKVEIIDNKIVISNLQSATDQEIPIKWVECDQV